jgi:hypothetical protein
VRPNGEGKAKVGRLLHFPRKLESNGQVVKSGSARSSYRLLLWGIS